MKVIFFTWCEQQILFCVYTDLELIEKMINVLRFTYKNLKFETEDFKEKNAGQMNVADLLELDGETLDALHYYDSYAP